MEDAYDLKALIEQMRAVGLEPIVRMYAFEDHVASRAVREMAVHHIQGDGVLWLDDYPDQGGQPWLDPYSSEAQSYVQAIALECVEMGARYVVMESIHFPTVALDATDLASKASTKSFDAVLEEFVLSTESPLQQQGAVLIPSIPVTVSCGVGQSAYGGDPTGYGTQYLAVDASPALWGSGNAQVGLTDPVLDPGGTVRKTLSAAKLGAGQTRLVAILQAYTDTTVPAASNREYTDEDVLAQIEAAQQAGAEDFILYDPEGTYPAL